jgi:PAS domain-containing protein
MERMELATQSGQIGIWEMEVSNSKVVGNSIFYKLLGIPNHKNDINFDLDILLGNVLNEDLIKLKNLFQDINKGKNYEETYFRVRQSDHSIRYIKITKPYLSDKNLILGAFIDITSQIQNEEQLKNRYERVRQFIELAPSALAMLDNDLNFLAVSNQFLDDNQLIKEDIIVKNFNDVFIGIPSH